MSFSSSSPATTAARTSFRKLQVGDSWATVRGSFDRLTPLLRHDLVNQGVSTSLLITLLATYDRVSKQEVYAVIGISEKTAGRRKDEMLPREAADATLALIEITSLAESVLGSHAEAEQWLVTPALGLDGRKPIDLIATRAGAEMVKAHLVRMDHGVYA